MLSKQVLKRRVRSREYLRSLAVLSAMACNFISQGVAAVGDIRFEDITSRSGISYWGESKGSAWSDFNGDGWMDVWTTNRYANNQLYLNNGDGTFRNFTNLALDIPRINYGAAWGDFDNDGDPDLFNMGPGGCSGNCAAGAANGFGVNDDGLLTNKAAFYGVEYPDGRGRTPLWFDWNQDGRLDVLLANRERPDSVGPTALFTQGAESFVDDTGSTLISGTTAEFAQLVRLTPGGPPRLVLGGFKYPEAIYDYATQPFTDLQYLIGLPVTTKLQDAAVADLNGDLLADVFVTRKEWGSAAEIVNPREVRARLSINSVNREYQGIRFKASGPVQFSIYATLVSAADLRIGATASVKPSRLFFTLDPANPEVAGLVPYEPGVDKGVYIGYDPGRGFWDVQLSSPTNQIITLSAVASSVKKLKTAGFVSSNGALTDSLLIQRGSGFIDSTSAAGLAEPTPCGPVVAGDFDNDTDLDLYLVCLSVVNNLPNILYENLGDGTFVPVPLAGGAQGSTFGSGESVATVDIDNDGFLDLFVTNGEGGGAFGSGPHQLFRNLGSSNHWLEIDLEGVRSNRDAVGAQVVLTADGVSQVRTQDGGMHHSTQNSQRLHFGLGSSNLVDHLTIYWPSGITQELNDIPADQIIHVVESSEPSLLGKPVFNAGNTAGVYLWKETFDGPYHVRASSDGSYRRFEIDVLTDQAFDSASPVQLEQNDALSFLGNYLSLTSYVTGVAAQDGVDFSLPLGAKGFIAVRQNGVPNPRQLYVGASGNPLTPVGWVMNADDLPVRPNFVSGQDLGLFAGIEPTSGEFGMHWNGDGTRHVGTVNLISSKSLLGVQGVALEPSEDSLAHTSNTMNASGIVSTSWDGVNVMLESGSKVGISYEQDGHPDWRSVNPLTKDFGAPNAYALPVPDISGKPQYDAATHKGVFIWKDETDVWHLRAAAGSSALTSYRGAIVGSAPVLSVAGVYLEDADTLNSSKAGRIEFDFRVEDKSEDGFDFSFPKGTTISLELNDNTEASAKLVTLGAAGWTISRLPVSLAGAQP